MYVDVRDVEAAIVKAYATLSLSSAERNYQNEIMYSIVGVEAYSLKLDVFQGLRLSLC